MQFYLESYILSEIWPKALCSAHNTAAGEMGRERIEPIDLAWHDVFEADDALEAK